MRIWPARRWMEESEEDAGEATSDLPRNRAFVLLRYTLIIGTAYLILVEGDFAVPPTGIVLILALALASNVGIAWLPNRVVGSAPFTAAVTVLDTVWITACLVWSQHFNAEFFYLYFFVLLLSAIGENLLLIALGSIVVCGGYVYGLTANGQSWNLWSSPSLIRIPFLFSVAAFSDYLVDRTRSERLRSHALEEVNRVKSDFLATISHELRTPLSAILGYAEMARDEDLDPATRKQAIHGIDRAGQSLLEIIENTLALRRYEEGRDNVYLERITFAMVWQDLQHACLPLVPPKEVALEFEPPTQDVKLVTDRQKLVTIVRNLVSNALKFTDHGWVRVSAECGDTGLTLRVADTGVGIPSEDRERIFEMFRQADQDSVVQRRRGSGLGLYIARRFAEQLGGELALESEPGHGSVFTVTLPPAALAA